MNEIVSVNVFWNEEQPLTDSRNVAEVFGKQHNHVLRDIQKLSENVSNFGQMFFEDSKPDSYGRDQKIFYMNRDGFSLLAMGFTGSEALKWKLKYIDAFNSMEKALNTPEQIMSRALKIADQTIARLTSKVGELETAVQEMDGVIQNMAPKVDYADRILSSPDCMLVTQIAQDYGMSAKAFNGVLENAGIQRKVGGQWILYAAYQGKGYTKTRTNEFQHGDKVGTRLSTVWTQKGRMFLYTKLKDIGIVPKEEQENETA